MTHALLSTKPLRAPRHCHPHLSCTDSDTTYSRIDLDTTSYTSVLAFSRKKVLHVLWSRGQATCLMAGFREKTTYRSAPFLSGGGGARDALQRKATRGAISEVVRETTGWTWPDLIFGTSTSAFTKPPLCGGGPLSLCSGNPSFLCGEDGRRSRRNSRWSSGFTQMDLDG